MLPKQLEKSALKKQKEDTANQHKALTRSLAPEKPANLSPSSPPPHSNLLINPQLGPKRQALKLQPLLNLTIYRLRTMEVAISIDAQMLSPFCGDLKGDPWSMKTPIRAYPYILPVSNELPISVRFDFQYWGVLDI